MSLLNTLCIDAAKFRRWIVNVSMSYADVVVGGLIYIILTPVIVGRLGTEAYAIWVLSHTITFYFGFLDLGFGRAQVRYHAQFAARGQALRVRQLLGTTAMLLMLAGIAAALLATAIALSPATLWLDISENLATDFRLVLLILGLNLLLSFPGSTLDDLYEGEQRFDLQNLRSIVLRVLAAVAQVALLLRGQGLVALALVELCVTVLQMLVDVIVASRLVPGLFGRDTRFRWRMWLRIRRFALWTMLDDLLVEGTAHLDRFLVIALLPLALLSPYAIASAVAGLLLVSVRPLADTFYPMAAGLHAQRKLRTLARLTLLGSKSTLALAMPLAVWLVFFGDALLAAWIPEVAAEATAGLVALLAGNLLVSVFLWTSATVLLAMGRFRLLAGLTALEIVVSIVLMLLLVPRYGLLGIAGALLVSNIVIGFGLTLRALVAMLPLTLGELAGATLGRLGAAALPAMAVAVALRIIWPAPGLLGLGVSALLTLVAYLAGMLVVGATADERQRYLELLRGIRTPADEGASASDGGDGNDEPAQCARRGWQP